ncbi:S-type anion channel SLAH2-like [Panicum miliaceum]|uniref:S-type anion channel SLAH2-like n=1 Tax=Panicum miliaceum TaxID=4540 RepID=A0A3L6REX5_PANMI|nr:S-type anion channel SLAH2-like [Panicum miliaceum]
MDAKSSKSGALPPRNAEAVAHPKPPVHPPVPPPRRSEVVLPPLETQLHPPAGLRAVQPVSISLPASPGSFGVPTPTAAAADSADLWRQAMANAARGPHRLAAQDTGSNSVRFTQPDREAMMFRSQPIPGPPPARLASRAGRSRSRAAVAMNWDRRYDSFKTWSGKLERQITHLTGGPDSFDDDEGGEDVGDVIGSHRTSATSVPEVDRFYAALEGPELDQLKPSEDLVLPSDTTWPFLLRFPISAFGIPMGVSSQAILWKVIALSVPTTFLHVTSKVNLVLWCVSVALMLAVSATYACKVALYFEAVRREYYHPIRVNFFFAPWVTCLYLAIGVPHAVTRATRLPHWLWFLLMAPLLCLALKIYGQWMSGGQRRLSKVANPSNHLSLLGNFVGAQLGATMGLREGPLFFFAVGLAHYIVMFVTLYQRLPTNETLPKELHPVFFLFVAAPSVSSVAWSKITGEFGHASKVAFFVGMFLYASLGVRINFFRGFRFSLAWWAYTSPMASAAAAAIRYSTEVDNAFTKALCVALSAVATLTVAALLATTVVHAFVLRNLFPNDICIAITERKVKPIMEMQESHGNDIEATAA